MHKIHKFIGLWADQRIRFIAGIGLGLLVWIFSSKALSDILVFGAFIYALFHAGRGWPAWKQASGIAFIVLLVHHLLMLPFSVSPEMSVGDTERIFEILAGAFAIPVIFNDREKIGRALLYSAAAIALALGYDLIRMTYYLGPAVFSQAHWFQPFILNHSNVASMMAGLSFFVLAGYLISMNLKKVGTDSLSVRQKESAAGQAVPPYPGIVVVYISRFNLWPALACLAGIIICLAYLLIAASRGPQIAFALAFACSGLLLTGWRRKLIWVLVMIALGALLFTGYKQINPRFAEKATMAGFSDRDKVWKHTWGLIKERPWFGHGYGKRNFEMNYYASHPPRAKFHFPHCHQYWLKLLFEYGWTGLALYAAAWLILFGSLARRIFTAPVLEERLLPGAILLMLLFIHFYGLGDYPDNIVQVAQVWLVPAALVAVQKRSEDRDHPPSFVRAQTDATMEGKEVQPEQAQIEKSEVRSQTLILLKNSFGSAQPRPPSPIL